MGLFRQMFAPPVPRGATTMARPGPIDDYWYEDYKGPPGTFRPTVDTTLTVSTVWRGVNVLANTLAMLPFPVVEMLENDEGQKKATDHRLYRPLSRRPNPWQTSFQWRRMGMVHCVLRGNFYNRIVNTTGFGTELQPLHPDHVKVVDREGDGGPTIYEWQNPRTGEPPTRMVGGRDILHISGLGFDGQVGCSVIDLMRRATEGSINTESFGNSLFSRAPLIRGFFKWVGGRFDEKAKQKFEDSVRQRWGGQRGWHGAPVLERGMEWQDAKMLTAEDSQFIESREHSIPEFARWIGVPTVLLMHSDKTALYANAEQFFQSFLNFDIAHWFVNWEQTINQTLFLPEEQDRFKVEFNREGMLRGDATTRSQFYRVMIELGVFTPNEVRVLEGKNKLQGLDEPVKLAAPPAEPPTPPGGSAPPPFRRAADDDDEDAEASAVVRAAASSVTRREIAECRDAFAKWRTEHARAKALDLIYARIQKRIVHALALEEDAAQDYCARRRVGVSPARLEAWAKTDGAELVAVLKWARTPPAELVGVIGDPNAAPN